MVRHHVHRLAESVPRPVRRVRHGRRGHRATPVRHRCHQRPHPAPGGTRDRGRDRAGDLRRTLRPRHGPRRHRPVPSRPAADAGRRVLRAHRQRLQTYLVGRRRRHQRTRQSDPMDRPARRHGKVPARHRRLRPEGDRLRRPHGGPDHVRPRRRSRPDRDGASTWPAPRRRTPDATPATSRSAPTSASDATPTSTPARAMVHGSVAAFAHFSSMPGSTGAGLAGQDRGIVAEVGRTLRQQPAPPQRRHPHRRAHGRVHRPFRRHRDTRSRGRTTRRSSAALGIDRFVVTGPGFGADPDDCPHRHRAAHLRGPPRPRLTRSQVSSAMSETRKSPGFAHHFG